MVIFLSIIILTKNRPKQLRSCLKSILSQEPAGLDEIIVIDNNNNKSDLETDYFISFKNIRIIPEAGTISHCQNTGTRMAKNQMCVLIDDDCIAGTNWLKDIKYESIKNYNT